MEAELTVGIWAVIKMGHHSCGHRRVCWGREKTFGSDPWLTKTHPQAPNDQGAGVPSWPGFLVPPHLSYAALPHFLTAIPGPDTLASRAF